ncbi:MAG: hypothetical protein ACSHWV_08395 [Cellulophaga fucicola]
MIISITFSWFNGTSKMLALAGVEVVSEGSDFIITEVKKFTVDKTTLEMKLK